MSLRDDGADPRLGARPAESLPFEGSDPIVGRPRGGAGAVVTVAGFAVAAGLLFVLLNNQRLHNRSVSLVEPMPGAAAPSAPPPPLQVPAPPPEPAPAPRLPALAASYPLSAPPPPPVGVAPDGSQRARAPAVVVDLGAAQDETARVQPVSASGAAAAPSPTSASAAGGDEAFAQRLEDASSSRASATPIKRLKATAPQGTIIPAVLETAIDSDLPGFTRAVISRDVRNFDGTAVLIPRGSRLIGQYKSATSLGASRAFVIWTRIIRPDGVSIQIGSPGTDPLGRGGFAGQVDTHFFTRFSGAILLSVLNAGVAAVAHNPSTTITIGSPGAAVGAASSVQADAIAPTIKVPQGSAIDIFVARDLDFSDVEAAK